MSWRVGVFIACVMLSGCITEPPPGANSGVAILVDFSQSFAPLSDQDRIQLKVLGKAASSVAERVSQPAKLIWSAVTDESRRAPVLCNGPRLFQEQLRLRRLPAEYFTKPSELQLWAGTVCPDVVIELSRVRPAPYTDIYGAVNLAVESMSAVSGQKFLLIYSDMYQDSIGPPERLKPLSSYRVLLVWRAGVDSLVNMDSRLLKWNNELKAAGAEKVCTQPAGSLLAEDVLACLGPYDPSR